ncbi:hypothetical protein LR48_Vigan05g152400 [Vigna angularis]|uniref:Uncharacterized protein n=2 Tax=Phaseolus angularis TaxID=3914 RepID=A0A0L9UMZ8_PHAAN|nr:hypothetical protein LR48_Vigan05g152400 [Vigna angularis]BAT92251.1 hypothetical protein VIGAN_07093600 [Vigna angularis var. angularis]
MLSICCVDLAPHYTFSLFSNCSVKIKLVIEAQIESVVFHVGAFTFNVYASKDVRYIRVSKFRFSGVFEFFVILVVGDDYILSALLSLFDEA